MVIRIYKLGKKYCYKDKLLITKHNAYGCVCQTLAKKNNEIMVCLKSYRIDGKLHNKLGPALIFPDKGDGIYEYWVNGKFYDHKNFKKMITTYLLKFIKKVSKLFKR